MRITDLIQGMIVGAGVMFMLDPDRGKRRQALVRDQAVSTVRSKKQAIDVMQRDFVNRSRGVMHTMQNRSNRTTVSDHVLEERVRSAMGRHTSHSGAITVNCTNGEVCLSGDILANEIQDLVRVVQRVPGVRSVCNELTVHGTNEGISNLQGNGTRQSPERWTPAQSMVGVVGGALLGIYGLGRRGIIGSLMTLGGLGLIVKGFHDTENRFEPSGRNGTGQNGIGIEGMHESIGVDNDVPDESISMGTTGTIDNSTGYTSDYTNDRL
jgi:hypothetical protein